MIVSLLRHLLLASPPLWAAMLLWAVTTTTSAQVLVVLSDESAGYQEVADELRTGLASVRQGRLRIDVVPLSRLAGVDVSAHELTVTVGLAAAQAMIARESTVPAPPRTLCLLIPRLSFERLVPARASGGDRRISAVFIDQPLSRQLDLVRMALPGKRRLGVIVGPSSVSLMDELRARTRERALGVKVAEVAESSGVYGALQIVIPESDVLLALPDPVATNSGTVYGTLLASYRAQVPVVGFSEGLVKAGALLSLFSTSRQQGKQGSEIASRILAGDAGLPAPQYPRYFTVRVNNSVARSLGLPMEDEGKLAAALADGGDGASEASRPRSTNDAPSTRGRP